MRLSTVLVFATLMAPLAAAPAMAQDGVRRVHDKRHVHRPIHRHAARDVRRVRPAPRIVEIWPERGRQDVSPDTPYGPIYQTQEQDLQSRYDFATGKKGNIKEYWYR